MGNNIMRTFIRTWRRHATMQVATLAVLVGTYSVVSIFIIAQQNMEDILTRWGSSVKMSVYLDDGINESDKRGIERFISKKDVFSKVTYVSKDEAAKKFLSQVTGYSKKLLFNPAFGNPLPASYELDLASKTGAVTNFGELVELARELMGLSGVDDISYGQGWVENYASSVRIFSVTSWSLILVLLFGSLFIVGNSIRSSISQRRDEIEILELVGATNKYIRAPFIFEGVIMGLVSSTIALIFTYMLFSWQMGVIESSSSFWAMSSQLSFLSISKILLILFIGTVFGALGSYICVNKVSSTLSNAKVANN